MIFACFKPPKLVAGDRLIFLSLRQPEFLSVETDNAVIKALYLILTALSTPEFASRKVTSIQIMIFDDSAVNNAYNSRLVPDADAPRS
jgi:hypothetical protein